MTRTEEAVLDMMRAELEGLPDLVWTIDRYFVWCWAVTETLNKSFMYLYSNGIVSNKQVQLGALERACYVEMKVYEL
jgi:hypothetical protein